MIACVALLAGLVVGLGLILSGMGNPAKVQNFLDVFGTWDPSLALVMAGAIAVAIFAFLPWCQFRQGNVTVDMLAPYLPARLWASLAVIGNIAMSIISLIVTWQLWLGFRDKLAYGETSMILQMPVWWGYAAGVIGAVVFVLTCLYTVWRSLNEAIAGGQGTEGGAHI